MLDRETWCPPREFDYFRQISDVALNAGASLEDCESFDEQRIAFSDSLIHLLLGYLTDGYSMRIFSNINSSKLDSVVGYLVKIGSSIEHPNHHNETPLLSVVGSCIPRSITILQILLEHGANYAAKDKKGRGALHLAMGNFWGDLDDMKYYINARSFKPYLPASFKLSSDDAFGGNIIDFIMKRRT